MGGGGGARGGAEGEDEDEGRRDGWDGRRQAGHQEEEQGQRAAHRQTGKLARAACV